ncbi:MAG: endonuclease domain-containing protein, partial [Longimicrobiales bacterium]
YELDLFWPDDMVAIEIDGRSHHSSRHRFEGDRRKDAWLRARGIEVMRLSWRQITRDRIATAVQVGQALALARSRRGAAQYPAAGAPREANGIRGSRR